MTDEHHDDRPGSAGPGRSTMATRTRWRDAVALLAAIVLGAAACGGDDQDAGSGGDDDAPRTVRLLTYDSFALPEEAAAAFTERTGAEIEVVANGDSGSMLAGALLAAGNPEADVIFGIDNTSATRATDGDLLDPVDPPSASEVPDRYQLPGNQRDLLVPIDSGDVCMNLDTEWFETSGTPMPTTLEQLTEPTYRDLTVVSSPVTSSPGMALLIGTVDRYGEDGWQDFWARLRDNGVRVRPSWDDAYYTDYTVSGGDRPIVLSYASSPPVELIFSEGARTEPASAVLEDSCSAQVEYAGVLRGTDQPELAAELVDFMLSDEWQRELPLTNFVFPVIDVELPQEFVDWAVQAESPMGLSPKVVDEGREGWIEAWREQME
ncbi:MAG: thiamine ABC transporter substrate binding subunit [Microthrixaceae bacterium]